MSNRFTERAQRVILIAQEEAKRLCHPYVGTEHMLLGLIALGEGVAAQVLATLAVDLRRVQREIEEMAPRGDKVMLIGEITFTPRAKKVLEYAVEEAQHLGHSYVGTEHLLLGLLRQKEEVAARVLENLGLRLEVVKKEVLNLLGGPETTSRAPGQPARKGSKYYLSILVPLFNEEDNLEELAKEIFEASEPPGAWEVLFIDDGSTDRSFEVLKKIAARWPNFKALRLGRNFGQTAALAAGIDHAQGALIATLDADLQNDPRDLPRLLKKIDEGADVVSGWRKNRKDPWLTRRLPSQLANALISWITGVRLHDYGCTLKVYRREYLKGFRLYGEMHRFIPAFAGFLGARIEEVEVNHRPRSKGVSKYGLGRTFKVLLDLLTVKFMDEYMTKPIYLFGGGGAAMGLAGAVLAAWTLYKKFALGIFVKDQPLFQVSIFFGLIGFQLVLMGLLAEILIRVYYDIKDKPTYFVRETLGL